MNPSVRTLAAAVALWTLAIGIVTAEAPPPAPTCTRADEALWHAAQETVGIFVADDDQVIGGAHGAKKFSDSLLGEVGNKFLAGYYPASGAKETVCGQLDHWAMYRLGDQELDVHAHVKVDQEFRSFLEDVPKYSRGQPESACKGCLWGEVTVPESFAWFWQQKPTIDRYDFPERTDIVCGTKNPLCSGQTKFFAGQFCMYGPWIMEAPHEFHVEIHPLQAFWGQQANSAAVYVVDDDSDRFQKDTYFSRTFLSAPFRPWAGPIKAAMFQVVRVSPTRPASLVWRDDKGATSDEPQPLPIPGATLTLRTPTGVGASVVRACRTDTNDVQVLVRAPLATDNEHRWRGLHVSGTNTGITYSNGGQVNGLTAAAGSDDTSEWHIHTAVGWNATYPSIRRHLPENQRQWGNLADTTRWSVVGSQDAFFEAIGDTAEDAPEDMRSSFDVKLTNLDDPSKPVRNGDVMITLDYDRNIPTETPPNVERHPRAQARVFTVGVRFPLQLMTSELYAVPNVRVDITAHVTDRNKSESRTLVLYSIVPDFVASVSGYSLRRQHGAFPKRLSQLVPNWLAAEGCTDVTLHTFEAYLDGVDERTAPLPSLLSRIISPRVRAAGVVRQTVNYFLDDGTMTAEEFLEFEGVMANFLNVCLATM